MAYTINVGLWVAITVGLISVTYSILRDPLAHIPGPWYAKWTDIILKFNVLAGRGPAYIHELHGRYGSMVRISTTEVDVADPEAAQQIHRVKNEFLKSPVFYGRLVPGVQNLFTTTDVDFHRRHRRLLASPISESSLRSTFLPSIDAKIRLAIEQMADEAEQRGAADVLKWWSFMASDIIGELSFGTSFNMLEKKEKNQYARDLEAIGPTGGIRISFPTLYSVAMLTGVPLFKKAAMLNKNMFLYARDLITRHQNRYDEDPTSTKPTLFSKLYRAGEDGLSPLEVTQEAQGYIIAGSDTTANTLTYLVWSVCRNPAIKHELVEELQALADDFNEQDLKALPYLNSVIQETLRLYSAAPAGLPRVVPTGGAELAGYKLPGGSVVRTQAFSLHRNPIAFPNPEQFRPERWEKPTKEMKDSFMPFGGGSRLCIGLHLAQMEIRLAAARFFRRFPEAEVSNLEGMSDADMSAAMFFLMAPKGKRCLIKL